MRKANDAAIQKKEKKRFSIRNQSLPQDTLLQVCVILNHRRWAAQKNMRINCIPAFSTVKDFSDWMHMWAFCWAVIQEEKCLASSSRACFPGLKAWRQCGSCTSWSGHLRLAPKVSHSPYTVLTCTNGLFKKHVYNLLGKKCLWCWWWNYMTKYGHKYCAAHTNTQ